MRKGKRIGVVYPILPQHVDRMFDEKKDVFVKFSKHRHLAEGSVIVFRVSGRKEFAGEGVIKKVEKLEPNEAWNRYGDRIFLTKKDYDKYVSRSPLGERKSRTIAVYVLRQLRKYKKPVPANKRMTVAGYYITRKDYENIVRQVQN